MLSARGRLLPAALQLGNLRPTLHARPPWALGSTQWDASLTGPVRDNSDGLTTGGCSEADEDVLQCRAVRDPSDALLPLSRCPESLDVLKG